jgi:hypothetical protein
MSGEQSSSRQTPICLVLMPMLERYEAVRAVVARAIATAGAYMCRLEAVMEDADWQHWLLVSVARANFALVDVTDNNPFVMYELGLTHQRGIPVTLIVNGANERIPATVRGTPFLPYDSNDMALFANSLVALLQDMIQGLQPESTYTAPCALADLYTDYYNEALELIALFGAASSASVHPVSRSEFCTRLIVAEHRGDRMPGDGNPRQVARYLLARIISNSDDVRLMRATEGWISANY